MYMYTYAYTVHIPILYNMLYIVSTCLVLSALPGDSPRSMTPVPPRRHRTSHFRKRATSAPAEGPAHGLDFARHTVNFLRILGAEVARLRK